MQHSKPIKGGRSWKSAGYHPDVARAIERDARRFNVSLSFVQRAIVQQHYERVLHRSFDDDPLPAPRSLRVAYRRKA